MIGSSPVITFEDVAKGLPSAYNRDFTPEELRALKKKNPYMYQRVAANMTGRRASRHIAEASARRPAVARQSAMVRAAMKRHRQYDHWKNANQHRMGDPAIKERSKVLGRRMDRITDFTIRMKTTPERLGYMAARDRGKIAVGLGRDARAASRASFNDRPVQFRRSRPMMRARKKAMTTDRWKEGERLGADFKDYMRSTRAHNERMNRRAASSSAARRGAAASRNRKIAAVGLPVLGAAAVGGAGYQHWSASRRRKRRASSWT